MNRDKIEQIKRSERNKVTAALADVARVKLIHKDSGTFDGTGGRRFKVRFHQNVMKQMYPDMDGLAAARCVVETRLPNAIVNSVEWTPKGFILMLMTSGPQLHECKFEVRFVSDDMMVYRTNALQSAVHMLLNERSELDTASFSVAILTVICGEMRREFRFVLSQLSEPPNVEAILTGANIF